MSEYKNVHACTLVRGAMSIISNVYAIFDLLCKSALSEITVTFQGKLVVCGSILAGVAVIPAQAASLVEALLEVQEERRVQGENSSDAGDLLTKTDSSFASEHCQVCGTSSHREDAKYCWSCGSALISDSKGVDESFPGRS